MSSDNPDKKDLTRIEDLSEFLHNDDPEADRLLSDEGEDFADEDTEVSEMNSFPYQAANEESDEPPAVSDLSELDDDDDDSNLDDDLPELPAESDVGDDEELTLGQPDSTHSTFDSLQDEEEFASFSEDELAANDTDFESSGEDFLSTSPFDDNESDDSQAQQEIESEDANEESEDDHNADFGTSSPLDFTDTDTDEEAEAATFDSSDAVEFEARPQPSTADTTHYQAPRRENFEDLKKFANSLSYGDVSSPGNPPFSLILKDIKYREDAEDILAILREHKLVNADNEKDFQTGLEHGALLLGQLSEYSAIYLSHRLRRFDLDLSIGLADEIHPSKSYEREGRGLITKDQLYQNKRSSANFEHSALNPNDIIIATTATLQGYKIERYIDVITEHTIITESELRAAVDASEANQAQSEEDQLYQVALAEVYHSLMQDLKPRAYKLGGNAVVGVNFALTHLSGSDDLKITCVGNVAWVNND